MTESTAPITTGRARFGSVLVCDDEPKLALLTAGLLQDHGFDALTVNRGDEALARIGSGVGVLLLDVNLGDGPSAFQVLEEMKRRSSTVPAILTSGFAAEDLPERLIQHVQVTGYLSKPYTVDQLVAQVRAVLALSGSHGSTPRARPQS